MSKTEVVNKMKTLSQGQYSESVLDKMAMTFTALCSHGDFESVPNKSSAEDQGDKSTKTEKEEGGAGAEEKHVGKGLKIGGLVYNIQLILPESRDPKVYDALFESLKRHLS